MHDSDRMLDLAKATMRERQREAALDAMRSQQHSRSGLLGKFLRDLAERVDPTGSDRREF